LKVSYEKVYEVFITFLSDDLINFKSKRTSLQVKYSHLSEKTPKESRDRLFKAIKDDIPIDLLIKITQNEGKSKCHTVLDASFS